MAKKNYYKMARELGLPTSVAKNVKTFQAYERYALAVEKYKNPVVASDVLKAEKKGDFSNLGKDWTKAQGRAYINAEKRALKDKYGELGGKLNKEESKIINTLHEHGKYDTIARRFRTETDTGRAKVFIEQTRAKEFANEFDPKTGKYFTGLSKADIKIARQYNKAHNLHSSASAGYVYLYQMKVNGLSKTEAEQFIKDNSKKAGATLLLVKSK